MKKTFIILLLLLSNFGFAQQNLADSTIIVTEAVYALNSGKSEYSPFLWKNKLYFISNRNNHSALYFSDKTSRNGVSNFFQPEKEPGSYSIPQHLAHKLNAKYNEGPFCFVENGIYITCNQVSRGFVGSSQPLEIRYSTYTTEKGFTEAKRIPIDLNDTISFAHPALINDSLMVFAANIAGGKGKVDLYYSVFSDKHWQRPVNILSLNSSADEMFPFYSNGYLYFSSDRPGAYGKFDIYKSKVIGIQFNSPELLKSPINSKGDDFSFWMAPNNKWGYFSSNRNNTEDDIYWFSLDPPLFENCKPIEKPNYCFLFYEESGIESKDTLGMYYEWDFGDGAKMRGLEVRHCFPGPGKYKVELNIIDKSSGALFYNQVSYDFFIDGEKVVYFDVPDSVNVEKPVVFTPQFYSKNKNLGKLSYHWNFGDRSSSNKTITPHVYNQPGKYSIKLSVFETRGDSVFKTCVEKYIHVIKPTYNSSPFNYRNIDTSSRIVVNPNRSIHDTILAENPMAIKEKNSTWKYDPLFKINKEDSSYSYKVHLGISINKISPNDTLFKGLTPITYNKINDLYHYSFGNAHNLAESKPLYLQARKKGFENAIVAVFKGDSLIFGSNIENMFKLIGDSIKLPEQNEGKISLIIFFGNGKFNLSEEAKKQVDRLFDQNKNKSLKSLKITGHTDESGSPEVNDKISSQRAESVTEYIHKKGIDKSIILTNYKGSKQPLLTGDQEKNRDYNRRVEIELSF